MLTSVIWCCVFNLFWSESCRVYAFSGMLLATFFIQRIQAFLKFFFMFFLHFLNVFEFFVERFFTNMEKGK